jgi:hypothetical protein
MTEDEGLLSGKEQIRGVVRPYPTLGDEPGDAPSGVSDPADEVE